MVAVIGLVFLAVYALLVFYIGWSGWSWMKPNISNRFKWFYISAVVFLALSFMLGRMLPGIPAISIIGAYWIAVFVLLLLILPIVHLTLWLLRLTRLPRHSAQKWAGILTLATLISLIGYGTFNAYSPVVRHYDLTIAKTAPDLEQLNVVMIADTHFGYLSGAAHARRMVETINELQPDLVLFPGDIIDDNLDIYLKKDINGILAEIEAPYGVYASLGNHDKDRMPVEELIAALEKSGMRILYDERVTIDGKFTLIGRKDRTEADRAPLTQLLAGTDDSLPLILLDHQPYELGLAAENGIDLMVSGHTHRGQIAPGHLITRLIYENDWGHLQIGHFHSVVTSGYGFWGPPIRIGSRSEIVQLTLHFQ